MWLTNNAQAHMKDTGKTNAVVAQFMAVVKQYLEAPICSHNVSDAVHFVCGEQTYHGCRESKFGKKRSICGT